MLILEVLLFGDMDDTGLCIFKMVGSVGWKIDTVKSFARIDLVIGNGGDSQENKTRWTLI